MIRNEYFDRKSQGFWNLQTKFQEENLRAINSFGHKRNCASGGPAVIKHFNIRTRQTEFLWHESISNIMSLVIALKNEIDTDII